MRTHALKKLVLRYGLAMASVSAAMLLTYLLRGIGDSGISPLFFAAVLLTAWYGGFGPGLLATFLSGIATACLLLRNHEPSFAGIQEHIVRLLVIIVVSLLTSSLHGAMKRAAEASRRAKEAAESASEAKSRFLAMVSHELRTPLSPVLLLTEMLQQDPTLPLKLKEDIRSIRRNVDLEIRLIEDLVDLTRISTGKMNLKEQVIDVLEPLKAAIEVCRDDLREKQLDLTIDLSAPQSQIVGDPVRLQQVFWNLIRNAVKFTPEGGAISVSARNVTPAAVGRALPAANVQRRDVPAPEIHTDVPENAIRIDITDTGIGIDSARLSRIFNAFEQGEPDIHIRFGGLGLGLAICQALVDAHKGTITAASEGKGLGAIFTVTFPVMRQALTELGASTTRAHS